MTPRHRPAFIRTCFAAASLMAGMHAAATEPSDNRCWGEIAAGLAQYDSPNVTSDMNGGAMGMHSRSEQGADINGGFASSGFIGQPRAGVGNVSSGAPHNTAPGDGGNGQHAVNNGEFFSTFIDPVTGTFMGGTGEPIECSLDVDPNIGF